MRRARLLLVTVGIALVATLGVVGIASGTGATDTSPSPAETAVQDDEEQSIQYSPFYIRGTQTTVPREGTYTSEILMVSPEDPDAEPRGIEQDRETMAFGSDVDRSFQIRHPETGNSVTVRPQDGEETYDGQRIELEIYNGLGEIYDEPTVTVVGEEFEEEVAVDVTGDMSMFEDRNSTFESFEVALLEGREAVDTTGERLVGIAYEGSIEQSGTSGEITLTVNRDADIDADWYVQFRLFNSDISSEIDHSGTEDNFEFTIDVSEMEPGNYSSTLAIYRSEPNLGDDSILPGDPIVRIFDGKAITVTDGGSDQTGTGVLSGTVTGEDGDPIDDVAVKLYDTDGSFVTEAATGDDGTYQVQAQPGTYDALFSASGYAVESAEGVDIVAGEETTVDVGLDPLESAAYEVTAAGADDPVTAGETISVDATVENVGDEGITKPIELRTEDGTVLAEQSLALGPGQTQSLTLEWATDSGDAGTHRLTVASETDTDAVEVDVASAASGLQVDIEQTNSPVSEGQQLDVRASIENVAEELIDQQVTLRDDSGTILEETSVSLDSGATETIQLSWDTGAGDAGEHTLSVDTAGDSAETTAVVDEFSLGVLIQPNEPTLYETVTFSRVTFSLGGDQPERDLVWEFGDGAEAAGDTVSHEYTTGGSYEVTVTDENTGAQDSFEVAVGLPTIDDPEIDQGKSIRGVDREYGGTPLEGVTWEESFSVNLYQTLLWNVETIEYELGDRTKTASSADESVTFDLGDLDGDSVLTVTVVDEDGTTEQHTEAVAVTERPASLAQFFDAADIEVDQEAGEVDVTGQAFDMGQHLPFGNVPFPGDGAGLAGETDVTLTYDADAAAGTLDGGGELGGWQPIIDINAVIDVDGTLDSDLELVEAEAAGQVEVADIPALSISFSVSGDGSGDSGSDSGSGSDSDSGSDADSGSEEGFDLISVSPTFDVRFAGLAEFDENLIVENGVIQPGASIAIEASLDVFGCGISVSGGGGIDAAYSIEPHHIYGGSPNDPDSIEQLGGEITLSVGAKVYCLFLERGVEYEWSNDFGSGPEIDLLSNPAQQNRGWGIQSKRGQNPDAVTESGFDRLSDRPLSDTQPAITERDGALVVAWSAQDEDKPVTAGRDLRVRTYDEVRGGWSQTDSITDDGTFDERPTLASTDEATIAAWTTVDKEFEGEVAEAMSGDPFSHQEIAYAIDDGDGWSDQVVLTETATRQHRPAVTAVDGGWVLAWESEADETTTVNYAIVDTDGGVHTRETITSASTPALGATDGGASLAYTDLDDGTFTTMTVGSDGSATERHSYEGQSGSELATGGGRTLWVDGSTASPRLYEATADGVTELDLAEDITSVADLGLTTREEGAVLSYRARVDGQDSRDLVYRLDGGDGWIQDRSFASPPSGLSTWFSDVTFGADGDSFYSAFAAQPVADDPKNDIFVTEHELRPAYEVEAAATQASVGESSTVSYEVTNVGDLPSESSPTVVVEGDSLRETARLGALAAGESVEGTLDAEVGESGTFTVSVEPDEETLTTGQESTTATASTPALSVTAIDTERLDSGDIEVTATVSNDGNAVATDVPLQFGDGVETLASADLERVDAAANATATAALDSSNLDGSVADWVRIDTDVVPAAHIREAERLAWFLQPNIQIATVNYVDSDGIVAEVILSNRGSAATDATLTVVERDTGTELGRETVPLGHASAERPTFVTAEIPLGTVAEGTSVQIFADTAKPDADPSTTGLADEVGPALATDRPQFAVTFDSLTTGSAEETLGATVTVENLGGEADSQEIALSADGETLATASVELAPGASESLTLDVEPGAGSAPSVDVQVRSATNYDEATLPIETAATDNDDTGDDTSVDDDADTSGEEDSSGDGADDDGAGFGLIVALISLLGAGSLLQARRRSQSPEA